MSYIIRALSDDPEMDEAFEQARKTFRFFWSEMWWESMRIIPAISLSCIKQGFNDPLESGEDPESSEAEQMWVNEVYFNGKIISGKLVNVPNALKSVRQGDLVRTTPQEITDWMYVFGNRVYGGFTVNLLRSRMSSTERTAHDRAWGLDFGDPKEIKLVPDEWFSSKKGGLIGRLFSRPQPPPPDFDELEHPMAVNMAPEFDKQLQGDPKLALSKDSAGWTNLHNLALAGSSCCVSVLLKHGADPNAVTNSGLTPLQLARSLKWNSVADLLLAQGARE